jgi:hypothetical protein
MKPIKSLIILAIVATSGIAAAQPYAYGPPRDPQGFHRRAGRLALGFSFGLGYMNDNGQRLDCAGCDVQPITGMLEGHIGGMLSNRMALLFEIQGNAQQIALDPTNDVTLRQVLIMGALQYWLTPIVWIKGGIGVANVDVIDNNSGIVYGVNDSGLGLMAGIGVELLSARHFALDLQGRLTEGIYHYNDGTTAGSDNITSGTIGLGLNWY